jgi:glucose/arabinose dehydrogenase
VSTGAWIAVLSLAPLACGGTQRGGEADLVHDPPTVVEVPPPLAVALAPAFGSQRFQRALDAAQAPGDDVTWYVVEQRGLVLRLVPDGEDWAATPFLDIRERTGRKENEEGLLGLAFSPFFAEAGHAHEGVFYVDYTVKPGRLSRLSRFRAAPVDHEVFGAPPAAPRVPVVDAASEEVLLEVEQPYGNHNGGCLRFGPDGMLYYGLGDGGSGGDPHGHGQDPGTLLGAILRLDVGPQPDGHSYGIPADNPLLDRAGARPEVWAYGLRNPWRMAFDPVTGELWAGDVGQNKFEFIHVIQRGGNHGWNLVEGWHRFRLAAGRARPADIVRPVYEYPQPVGLSITGGAVYRGRALPELDGWYVYADYVTKTVWAIRRQPDDVVEHTTLLEGAGVISSFAEGHDGELLVIDHQGPVWRLVRAGGD